MIYAVMNFLSESIWGVVALSSVIFVLGLIAAKLFVKSVFFVSSLNGKRSESIVAENLSAPLYFLMPLSAVLLTVYSMRPILFENDYLVGAVKIALVFGLTWLCRRVVAIVAALLKRRFDMTITNNMRARAVHTQIGVLQRIASFIIILIGFAALFLLFDQLRSIGVSMIASAGVAGIVIGFAAQKALGNLFAGVQIAFTQPISLDDAVVVEGEWGWIEEITLTYVVVKIWDLRRLVLPISYFIEKPFENWTKHSPETLGTVYIYVDYTMPIEPIREALDKFVQESEFWDEKAHGVQVTDTKNDVLEVRLLMSAADPSKAWNLRCEIREKMVTYIQDNYPEHLPKTRAELSRIEEEGEDKKKASVS